MKQSDTPVGAYQVWHREGDEFRQVGSLKVANLLVAAEVAMNRPSGQWMDGAPEDARPTRTGDVLVSPDGGAFKLVGTEHGFTFESVSFGQLRQAAKEQAEFRAELMDGVKTAITGGASFRQIMQEAAAYGMKPEEVAEIRRGVEGEIRKEMIEVSLQLNEEMEKDPEEDLAYIADMLRIGDRLSDIRDEAAARGVTPEEVEALRRQVNEEMEEDRAQATEPVRSLTLQLIECCQEDVWPGRAAIMDFGLASSSHLGALQYAIREQLVTPQELDAAMGHGQKLTEMAKQGNNPYRFVTFCTAWDELRVEPREVEQEERER